MIYSHAPIIHILELSGFILAIYGSSWQRHSDSTAGIYLIIFSLMKLGQRLVANISINIGLVFYFDCYIFLTSGFYLASIFLLSSLGPIMMKNHSRIFTSYSLFCPISTIVYFVAHFFCWNNSINLQAEWKLEGLVGRMASVSGFNVYLYLFEAQGVNSCAAGRHI